MPTTKRSAFLSKANLLTILLVGIVVIGFFGYLLNTWIQWNNSAQPQNDPNVANVWRIATTYGPKHQVRQGASFQQWLNKHNIHFLGDYKEFVSPYNDKPSSIVFWFDYQSHLSGVNELECHRVNEAAFEDDLGNKYHAYLDFHGRIVGIYLPGYDHSAKKLICKIQWMPRKPAHPVPVSLPMTFTLDLPRRARLLPSASSLPQNAVVSEKEGVRVTISDVKLPLSLKNPTTIDSRSRNLSFQIKIDGGIHDSYNISTPSAPEIVFSPQTIPGGDEIEVLRDGNVVRVEPTDAFQIFDPYGTSLVSKGDAVIPDVKMKPSGLEKSGKTVVWYALVNDVGKGTDVVRFQFPVRKRNKGTSKKTERILFDMVVPVRITD